MMEYKLTEGARKGMSEDTATGAKGQPPHLWQKGLVSFVLKHVDGKGECGRHCRGGQDNL